MTELYIEDFRTLDEILDFVQEQIETMLKEFHQPKLKGLRKELESILKKDFLGVVEQYGLKGVLEGSPPIRSAFPSGSDPTTVRQNLHSMHSREKSSLTVASP